MKSKENTWGKEMTRFQHFTWKDVVKINDNVSVEEFPISGKMDGEDLWQTDDFYSAVAEKYGVDEDDIQTYTMDGFHFNAKELDFGAEDCGCYIDGYSELEIDEDELESYTKAANTVYLVIEIWERNLSSIHKCYGIIPAVEKANELLVDYIKSINYLNEYEEVMKDYEEDNNDACFVDFQPASFHNRNAWCNYSDQNYDIFIVEQ